MRLLPSIAFAVSLMLLSSVASADDGTPAPQPELSARSALPAAPEAPRGETSAPAAVAHAPRKGEEDRSASDAEFWPSLLLEPGAGAVVSPEARGAATFGFSVGIVRLGLRKSSEGVSSLFGLHAGYTLAPGADRGELTFTAGTGVSTPWVVALRGGPTIDTNGTAGFRAGVRTTVYHALGFEVFAHHGFSPRNDTSVFMVLTADMVPAAVVFIFAQTVGSLFK